ncbi:MAG: S4 domain-containing protein [Planctomycetota bacterium]
MGLFEKERDLNRAPDRIVLTVDGSFFQQKNHEVQVRLDQFLLAHLHWRSRTSIQKLIRDGQVLVDAATPDQPQGSGDFTPETRAGRKLRHGSRVTVMIPEELRLPEPEGEVTPVEVLYEEPGVLAVDKPPMVPVHPSGRHVLDVIQRVHAHCAGAIAAEGKRRACATGSTAKPAACFSSGCDRDSIATCGGSSSATRCAKFYQALVWGEVQGDQGSLRVAHRPGSPQRGAPEDDRQPRRPPDTARIGKFCNVSSAIPSCNASCSPAANTRSACTWPPWVIRSWGTGCTA